MVTNFSKEIPGPSMQSVLKIFTRGFETEVIADLPPFIRRSGCRRSATTFVYKPRLAMEEAKKAPTSSS